MAASQLRDTALARRTWQRLQTVAATNPQAAQQVRWLGMELNLAARDMTAAQLLALGGSTAPLRRPELLLQAQLAQQAGQAEALNTAAQGLQTWLANHPLDALAWQTLAGIYTAQNQGLRALRADAEVHAARLDYAAALDRLKAAQDQMRTSAAPNTSSAHIDASIIDTRHRQIEALLKEQSLDR
jgi:predicted Zn-dependent protease